MQSWFMVEAYKDNEERYPWFHISYLLLQNIPTRASKGRESLFWCRVPGYNTSSLKSMVTGLEEVGHIASIAKKQREKEGERENDGAQLAISFLMCPRT